MNQNYNTYYKPQALQRSLPFFPYLHALLLDTLQLKQVLSLVCEFDEEIVVLIIEDDVVE